MKLEEQVVSLELAKRLKELGVKQDSYFYWADDSIVSTVNLDILLEDEFVRSLSGINNDWPDQEIKELSSAYTVAELGEYLNLPIDKNHKINGRFHQNIYLDFGFKRFRLVSSSEAGFSESTKILAQFESDKEADVRAKMLIYLLENKLIKLHEDKK